MSLSPKSRLLAFFVSAACGASLSLHDQQKDHGDHKNHSAARVDSQKIHLDLAVKLDQAQKIAAKIFGDGDEDIVNLVLLWKNSQTASCPREHEYANLVKLQTMSSLFLRISETGISDEPGEGADNLSRNYSDLKVKIAEAARLSRDLAEHCGFDARNTFALASAEIERKICRQFVEADVVDEGRHSKAKELGLCLSRQM